MSSWVMWSIIIKDQTSMILAAKEKVIVIIFFFSLI